MTPPPIKVIVDPEYKPLVCFLDLSKSHQSDVDYTDPEEQDEPRFFLYQGNVHDTTQYVPTSVDQFKEEGWDGIEYDTFFSGTVIRFVDDNGSPCVTVATVFAP